jgi:hypothetical protein
MDTVQRNNDIVYNNNDLELLYTFKKFPVFMGCTEQEIKDDVYYDLNFFISRKSGMIQINPVAPLELVYQTEHQSGAVGAGWFKHHNTFAKFIKDYNPCNVFEIGGGHGYLSNEYYTLDSKINWTMIEPNPSIVESNATVIKGFFKTVDQIPNPVDAVVHSHFFEHLHYPAQFVQILSCLKNGIKVFFSIPDLKKQLEQKYTNVLNFEHTFYCTDDYVEWIWNHYGFKLLKKIYFENGHSIFYAFEKQDTTNTAEYINSYETNKTIYLNYIDYYKNLVKDLNKRIEEETSPVFIFGAHASTQYLLAYGLNADKINGIIDNSSLKEGKRLYGTKFISQKTSILKEIENPVVIVRVGIQNDEIKKDILKNINSNVTFI